MIEMDFDNCLKSLKPFFNFNQPKVENVFESLPVFVSVNMITYDRPEVFA